MLVLKLEIWPYGKKDRARTIGMMQIINTGGDAVHGDYDVNFYADSETDIPYDEKGLASRGIIKMFPRPLMAWQLILRAVRLLIKERNMTWGENDIMRWDGRHERLCEHGVGHGSSGTHGCDGCCGKPGFFE